MVVGGLIPVATIGKNGLLSGTNAYKNGIQEIKVASFPSLSQASFFLASSNPYAVGFLIYVEMVVDRNMSPILSYKVMFGGGTESDFKAGYKTENGQIALFISRPNVNMAIQCFSKTSNVELAYVNTPYPEDCAPGTKYE